jgi:hypothetical protein
VGSIQVIKGFMQKPIDSFRLIEGLAVGLFIRYPLARPTASPCVQQF